MATTQLLHPSFPEAHASTNTKPIVIGLYGISGCGKTYLLNQLKQELDGETYEFNEGSETINAVVDGGLDVFLIMDEQEKVRWRQVAIDEIRRKCATSGKVAVVTGHFMFWSEDKGEGRTVYTQNDLDTYTHIIYLNIPPEVIMQRRSEDMRRSRPSTSIPALDQW